MPRRYNPMPPLTRRAERALNKSILQKWAHIANGTLVVSTDRSHGYGRVFVLEPTCPLCELYIDGYCRSCPIRLRTGLRSCFATPYYDWVSAVRDYGPRSDEALAAAKRELRFLRNTLRLGLKAREENGVPPR